MKYNEQHYFKRLQLCTISDANYHQWYKRTVDYAKELKNIICAEEESKKELLKIFRRRETQEEFDRSLDFTHLLTRAMCEKIFAPVLKGSRNDQITPELKWKNDTDGKDTKERIDKFYGDKSLYQYCIEHVLSTMRYDPNAFVLVQFKPFDPNKEKAKPEAIIIPSSGAVDYSYENGTLDYLIVYSQSGKHFTLYLKDINIRLTEVDATQYPNAKEGTGEPKLHEIDSLKNSETTHIKIGEKVFRLEYTNEVKSGRVQAERIGHILDPWTEGETCVSLLHPAIPRIKLTLQKTRNVSLALDLHTFPQKVQARQLCSGFGDDTCTNGKATSGGVCKKCNGDGKEPVHEGPMDVIEVALATGNDTQIDLNNVALYIKPETDSTKLLWDFAKENTKESFNDVYTSNAFSETSSQKTATEVTTNYDSIHDKVRPEFSNGLRNVFRFMAEMVSTFLDESENLVSADLKIPADLQLYTLSELLIQLKSAIDSGAPMQVIHKIRDQILKMLHQDDNIQIRRDAVMVLHEPFADKTKEEIQFGASNGWITRRDAILAMNYDRVMKTIFKTEGEEFFKLDFDKQAEKISAQVDLIIEQIDGERTTSLQLA